MAAASVTVGTLLAFIRLTAFFVAAPFPGSGMTPAAVRIVLAASLAWSFGAELPARAEGAALYAAVLSETALGLSAGFLLSLILSAFVTGGEIAGAQMGLGNPSFIDPNLPAQVNVVGGTFSLIALLVFAFGDGFPRALAFLAHSFAVVPPGQVVLPPDALLLASTAGSDLFLLAVHAAAPLMAAVFASQMMLAVLAKSVPSLNLFVEGPALTMTAGVLGLAASIDSFFPLAGRAFLSRVEEMGPWLLGG